MNPAASSKWRGFLYLGAFCVSGRYAVSAPEENCPWPLVG